MNDGIGPQNFSLQYVKVDQVIRMVSRYCPGALMAKLNVESAYRNNPIHADDRFLLGMRWCGQFNVDLSLPFGLRSAPFIFNFVADMVEWILLHKHRLSDLLHYLDAVPPTVLITLRRQSPSAIGWGCLCTLTNVWVQPLL